ncbi:type VI secretion system protein TssA [Serratia marcescens]|uniref:type VI secretion system protein TssA n=1 Tax=Serratia marcescens TaxID=615 RepID=UPI001EF15ECA|nr:type VI secretion system protein TssA [Serratia marcescens]ULH11533.1 type VI secretion system protein TssA [Serratia marcescens]
MATLNTLLTACQAERKPLVEQTQPRLALWNSWLLPVSEEAPCGDDPGYDDDFQQLREEMDRLSGIDPEQICHLCEKLLTTVTKDIRVAAWYTWARLTMDGEAGLADGLELLAALLQRFGPELHPQRERPRLAALAWLTGSRMLDSLARYPEASTVDSRRIAGVLLLMEQTTTTEDGEPLIQAGALYAALESRLMKAGGPDAVVPQNSADSPPCISATAMHAPPGPTGTTIASGRDLLDLARHMTVWLNEQPDGWLAAHRLMKTLRHDTLQQLPPADGNGRTRIEPPKADARALLKRMYQQQRWNELREQADSLFSGGAGHLWLDLQWYIHQALLKLGRETEAAIIQDDLKGLLRRLPGLETQAFNDGAPFADEVTLNWIREQVLNDATDWQTPPANIASTTDNDILALEAEAQEKADSDGVEVALTWLQQRPGVVTPRERWLMQLLMARLAEQYGKNTLALHLLGELNTQAGNLTLQQWEPELLFEVKARKLKLLRLMAGRSEAEKTRLQPEMELLLAGLVALDPARAAVLCG